ncbi:MAG TPA: aminopeptidase P family protein, partial [Ruminococcaceae bacterium]|nr:aminopeptidase P family protein [Oscillospiraceae bacterium]
MDFGAEMDGYHSDMTRTVAVGYVSDEMAVVYDTVLRAQASALETLKPGAECAAADAAARAIISGAGFGE